MLNTRRRRPGRLVVGIRRVGLPGADRFDEARGELFVHLDCMRQRGQKSGVLVSSNLTKFEESLWKAA